VVLAGLLLITALAWIYVIVEAHRMTGSGSGIGDSMSTMSGMDSTGRVRAWTGADFGVRFAMWAVMMVAMMTPTAAPMTLMYAAVARKASRQRDPIAPTFVFVAGYLTVWTLFSVAAVVAQWGLDRHALLSPMMVSDSTMLGSALLVAAGVYQLTPLKDACLKQCRAPAHFLSRYWHSGALGSFRTGLSIGAYCLGCCWILMALLFVGGVMNLLWIAAISIFVLLEKTAAFGRGGGRLVGVGAIVAGLLGFGGLLTFS
jgi:predicted metal-binding membrane protein